APGTATQRESFPAIARVAPLAWCLLPRDSPTAPRVTRRSPLLADRACARWVSTPEGRLPDPALAGRQTSTLARWMGQRVETDITVQRFGFVSDEAGSRLKFPRAESHEIEGWSGPVGYGARDCVFDDLEGRLDTLRWTADAASVGAAWLR